MYSLAARMDTFCGVVKPDTLRIIDGMAIPRWAQRARTRMKQLGKTQEDLMSPLGVTTRGAVGHYLTGRRDPSPDQLSALGKELECGVGYFFDNSRQPSAPSSSETREGGEINRAWLWEAMQEVDRISAEEGRQLSREHYHQSVIWFYGRIADRRRKKPSLREIRAMLETVTGE